MMNDTVTFQAEYIKKKQLFDGQIEYLVLMAIDIRNGNLPAVV